MTYAGVLLSEALFVLAHRPDGKRVVQRKFLKVGLGGAVLMDLVLQRRLSLAGGKVVFDDAGVAPSEILSPFDAMVRSEVPRRSAKHWVRRFRSADVERRFADHSVVSGLATIEMDTVLGFISVARYVPNRAAHSGLETHISDVLAGHATVTEWDASLVGLCAATGVLRRVFPDTQRGVVKEITEGAWASEAVRKVIKQANATVRNAVIATVNANNGSQGF